MVTIPFSILSHEGELVFVDEKSLDGMCGQAHQEEMHVRIKEGMSQAVTGTTVIHEIIHIIEFLTGTKFEESEIDCISLGLYSFFQENPHIREMLFEEEEQEEEEVQEYEYASEVSPFCSWQEGVYPNKDRGTAALSGVLPSV